ncbi:MAG: HIT domain-containing protein [Deltaproteobacteria bacterium]|nr:MAG: HIT domain-containing protein [Deltaproteobacteria bacterium]TNF28809.1 MAG: HIT domain-containing protein [Deltaproteobacteria bacterium]
MSNSDKTNPGDLDFDEGTGEMSLELNLNPKKSDGDPSKAGIGHVERMKQKRERQKLGLDDLEDEVEAAPKAKVEKVADAEEEEAPQEFRPQSMQAAREETSDEAPQAKVAPAKKVEPEKVKDLDDALGLNDLDNEEDEEESEQDAATRRVVLDDLMFEEEQTEDISSQTDVPDHGANTNDLEALIADEEDEEYQVEAGESASEGVQVAGSEINFKKEQLEGGAAPVAKPQEAARPQAAVKGVHPKCNFCKMAHGKFKLAVLYQDEHVIAIMDPKPLSKGQLLLAPKKHVGSLTELSDQEVQHFFNIANNLCKTLKDSKVPADAVSYFLSESVNEAPELRHIYMSIIPRTNKDGIGLKYKKKINSTPDDLELICDHLIQYIKK